MKNKQKIVFISSRFPLPLVGGFEIKNFQLLKSLSTEFEVSAHFITHAAPAPEYLNTIKSLCKYKIYKPKKSEVLLKLIINIFTGEPLQNALYFCKIAAHEIKYDLDSADAAICSVIRTCEYIENFDGPKFFDLADSLGQVYQANIQRSSGFYKLAYRIESPRLLRKEQTLAQRAAGVFFFNKNEASRYASSKSIMVVPHGVNEEIFSIDGIDEDFRDGVTFIGKLSVAHNVDMIKWFSTHVLPILPDNIKLYLIGAGANQELQSLARSNGRIIITGFLDNPYLALRASIACICPLQTGGGVQNKVIESLASGSLTIATSKAASAFNNPNESGILVCDTPAEWRNTIIDITRNPNKYQSNREIGRNYAARHFSWKTYSSMILDKIKSSLTKKEA